MKTNVVGLVILLLVIIVFSLFSFEVVVFIIYIFSSTNFGTEEKFNNIKILQYDSNTNEITRGTVSIFGELENEKSIFKNLNNGKYSLISNFGSPEYKCTGSCLCEQQSERRNSIVLKSGIIYLLTAVSSIASYHLSKEFFVEECKSKYSEICPMESIKTEIEKCLPMIEKKKKEKISVKISKYWCKGNCLMREKTFEIAQEELGKSYSKEEYLEGKKKCESIESENEVIVSTMIDPRRIFQTHLEQICIDIAKYEITNTIKKDFSGELPEDLVMEIDDVDLWCPCVAGYNDGKINPTITCKLVE